MSILIAVGMAIGVLIESLLGGPTVSITTSGNSSGGDRKGGGAREWIKNKLKALSQSLGYWINSRQSIGSPTRNYRCHTFMDFEQSKRCGWLVVSKFVAIYNRCWSSDIHIFYDKNKNKINHLNIHHTVKIVVIPNIKAAFS